MIYDENSKTEQERGSNNIVKDWQQFANDGMLWLVNMILHIFGSTIFGDTIIEGDISNG